MGKERKQKAARTGGLLEKSAINQRLENWGARRAAFRPYFLGTQGRAWGPSLGAQKGLYMLGGNEFRLR